MVRPIVQHRLAIASHWPTFYLGCEARSRHAVNGFAFISLAPRYKSPVRVAHLTAVNNE